VADTVGGGKAYGNLGFVCNSQGKFRDAKECFKSSIVVFDIVRASLNSDYALRISFLDLCHDSYNNLWKTLLALDMTDKALCVAERGPAQALVDGLKIQYGLTAFLSVSLESKKTVSCISNKFSAQTVFLGPQRHIINF